MYIDKLSLKNIRTFVDDVLEFIHPETEFKDPNLDDEANAGRLPKPRLPNVNLLLGENGAGKTTVLQAIALASLGPVAPIAQLPVPRLVRTSQSECETIVKGDILSEFILHRQDSPIPGDRCSHLVVYRHGELENMQLAGYLASEMVFPDPASVLKQPALGPSDYLKNLDALRRIQSADPKFKDFESALTQLQQTFQRLAGIEFNMPDSYEGWELVTASKNQAYFCVSYGATRQIDPGDNRSTSIRPAVSFLRGTRLKSVFQESFSLYPLRYWLPAFKTENPERYTEILNILNSLISDENCRLTDEERDGDLLFERHGLKLPLSELSDGYRAFIAWVADLLYHLSYACPGEQSLLDCRGIVLVDEIDLHLHPRWQMKVVSTIANAFPKMQFIFTSHSPLIVGSVEWMNILTLQTDPATNETDIKRWPESVHGLDADQILLTKFFGLTTTRAGAKVSELEALREAALAGDRQAARALLRAMSTGTEYQP